MLVVCQRAGLADDTKRSSAPQQSRRGSGATEEEVGQTIDVSGLPTRRIGRRHKAIVCLTTVQEGCRSYGRRGRADHRCLWSASTPDWDDTKRSSALQQSRRGAGATEEEVACGIGRRRNPIFWPTYLLNCADA